MGLPALCRLAPPTSDHARISCLLCRIRHEMNDGRRIEGRRSCLWEVVLADIAEAEFIEAGAER